MSRFADCHPDKAHQAKGLCAACYSRERRKRGLDYSNWSTPKCHPDRLHKAQGLCDACYWRKRNSERSPEKREFDILRAKARKYGFDGPDDLRAFMDSYDNRCAACSATENLVVDHDHESGAPRGILCGHCNLALGHALDDPERLKALASYMEGRIEKA